LKKFPGDDS